MNSNMIAYIILGIIIVVLFIGFNEKRTNKHCRSRKRLDGKTVVVTGGTSGIGLEIATDMAERGARVIVACPFEDEGARGTKIIIEQSGSKNVVFKYLDLQSIESVKSFAKDITATERILDILVNNAGTAAGTQFLTKDKMNFLMAVNYYGTVLLTLLLLPLLRKTGTPEEPARTINTSSISHIIGVVDLDNMNALNRWTSIRVYGNSKLCLLLFSRELTRRLKGTNVVVNCVDPGIVGTMIFCTYIGFIGYVGSICCKYLLKTPWEGAQTALYVALDKHAGTVSGEYFRNCAVVRAKTIAYDDETAARLWEHSIKLVCLDEPTVNSLLYSPAS